MTNLKCYLCNKNVFLPTTWNKINSFQNDDKLNINYNKCEKSFTNPCCLNCIKKYINKLNHPIWITKTNINCPYNCCSGFIMRENIEKMYGEINRKNNDLVEKNIWNLLNIYETFNLKCNICNKKNENIQNAFEHSKNCF